VKRGLRGVTASVLVRVACFVGLVALAFMAWPLFVPRAVPVLASMSVGQGLGIVALACYLGAIIVEVGRHDRAERALNDDHPDPSSD
jgi:hypothetical protein